MATKLYLRRFATWDLYQDTYMPDGTFFVIIESGQLGVRKGDVDILTPPNTLYNYTLPEGEIVITQNDTIAQAIGKLQKQIMNLGDNSAEALNTANDAITAVRNLDYSGDRDPDVEARLTQLESKVVLIYEADFEELKLEGIDRNKIYYIYEEND